MLEFASWASGDLTSAVTRQKLTTVLGTEQVVHSHCRNKCPFMIATGLFNWNKVK